MKNYHFVLMLTHPITKEMHSSDLTIKAASYKDAKAIIGHYGITHWVYVPEDKEVH